MVPEFKNNAGMASEESEEAARAYEKLKFLYGIIYINFLVEKTPNGNRAHVSVCCDTPENLAVIKRHVVRSNPDFQNVKRVSSTVLSFDLSADCVKRLYDVPVESPFPSYDPIDPSLIEKYGGRDTFIGHLADILERKTVIEVTASTATMVRHASQSSARR